MNEDLLNLPGFQDYVRQLGAPRIGKEDLRYDPARLDDFLSYFDKAQRGAHDLSFEIFPEQLAMNEQALAQAERFKDRERDYTLYKQGRAANAAASSAALGNFTGFGGNFLRNYSRAS